MKKVFFSVERDCGGISINGLPYLKKKKLMTRFRSIKWNRPNWRLRGPIGKWRGSSFCAARYITLGGSDAELRFSFQRAAGEKQERQLRRQATRSLLFDLADWFSGMAKEKPKFHIYNTMTKQKEVFEPRVEGKVGMYVCGVTSYDLSHIGHARAYVAFDILYRFLLLKCSIWGLTLMCFDLMGSWSISLMDSIVYCGKFR